MKKQTTKITSKSIESSVSSDVNKAIAEYIWNGFDAGASIIRLNYDANEVGYINIFEITDNGSGISRENIENTFGNFLDSQKAGSFNADSFIKGKKGKGRYSFSSFCDYATWDTTFKSSNEDLIDYKIKIDKNSSQDYLYDEGAISKNSTTGTCVKFESFTNLSSQTFENDFSSFLSSEFGWFLFLNKARGFKLYINEEELKYEEIIEDSDEIDHIIDDFKFTINYLRWNRKIGDKYYFYFLKTDKKQSFKKHTSLNNKSNGFHHSIYVESDYFDEFSLTQKEDSELGFERNQTDVTYKKLSKILNKLILEKEKSFLREHNAIKLIEGYRANNVFPTFRDNEYDSVRKQDLESVVKEIYCVQPKIFEGLKLPQSKTLVGFLNLLLDTEQREEILNILESIVELSEHERAELSKMLQKTKMTNILTLVKFLENRFKVVEILKELVFTLEKFTTERDHIQKVIENNYWLFGEQYHIVSADDNFEIMLNNYLCFMEQKPKDKKVKIETKGKLKRPDIFISRQNDILDTTNSENIIEENIIVELKRPSIVIGKEQFDQVEGYLRYIIGEPRFNSTLRTWKFILIGKTVDQYLRDKQISQGMKGKKYLVESVGNYEIYAMTWDDLFTMFTLKHKHFINKLEFKKSIIEELEIKGVHLGLKASDELVKEIGVIS